MSLLTTQQKEQLLSNGRPENTGKDHYPVVKLFMVNTACTWLLSEIDYQNEDIGIGLCDVGQGFPEIGSVSLMELQSVRLYGFSVERDYFFEGKYPISVYARAARMELAITENEEVLQIAMNNNSRQPSYYPQ